MKKWLIVALLNLSISGFAWGVGTTTGETAEVQFSSVAATDLRQQALTLATPAAVYEYVRNNYDYALYQGSRSGSINTYLGLRGNDVDLASTLIAMYRSLGVPTRYAVGTVRAPSTDVMNWLGVKNADLAASIMKDQGIQAVVISADKSTIDFEHAWVEALVPFTNYRGAGPDLTNINCQTQAASCHWIALDPSYKLRQYKGNTLDPYSALTFDYTSYYNAIKNQDSTRMDKNPLEIYQDQILGWLRTSAPGKTLDDVADPGTISAEQDGILPASLPYAVISSVRRYNAVDDHDLVVPATESKTWGKTATVTTYLCAGVSIGSFTAKLVDLATHKLTSTVDTSGATIAQVWRLDSVPIAGGSITGVSSITCNGVLIVPAVGTPYSIQVKMDGTPAPTAGGTDTVITATYQATMGSYYLIATGGETSNWSQVHRAAQDLLSANKQYPVVFNAAEVGCLPGGMNCTAYVDVNGNGWDATDPKLLDDKPALDALTGGMFNVAATQYYAKLRDQMSQADALNRVKTPISGFLGVVSSPHQVEYIDGTAFSVLPGGLLIDMKGITITGTWRIDQPATVSNSHFEFLGHVMSSLEHEIWQELTGYDAISTVRGIQMALANGATLINPMKNSTTDTMPAAYTTFGFTNGVVPTGFTYTPFNLFGTQPATWTNATVGAAFDLMLAQESTATPALQQSSATYTYSTTSGLYGWVSCVNSQLTYLKTLSSTLTGTYTFCDNVTVTDTVANLITRLQTEYLNTIIPNYIGQSYFNYFDVVKGFVPASYIYRARPIAANAQFASLVTTIRNNLYLQDLTKVWVEYLVPSVQSVGPTYKFAVDIRKSHDAPTGNLTSATFEILNDTGIAAGGGYVPPNGTLLTPATSIAVTGSTSLVPTFNNATMTNQNTVAVTNNNTIKTPSTSDPVSTVTGNNYHDETDITIKGRGLNIAFTRTYNSTPSASKTLGSLGYGWTHSYAMKLKSNDYGACPNCGAGTGPGLAPENGNNKTSSITYTDERGGDHNYLVNETTLAVTPPQGEFDTLAFDTPVAGQHTITFRNGTKYIFEGSTTLKTAINLTARLKTIQDAYGNQLNFTYDVSGRLSNIADNLAITGRTGLTFGYVGAATQINTISDWSGRIWTFGYDTASNLVSVTNPLVQAIQYTYAPGSHNLQDVILPELRNGLPVKTTFSYYQNGKAFNYQNALGQTETLDYDLYRKTTRVTDPRGGIRQYEYDSSGNMTKLIEPDGAELLFENSADGLRNKKYDGLGYATAYSYRIDKALTGASDTFGNVTREQDPLGFTLDHTYGTYDQIASVTDKLGRITSTSYYTTAGACAVIGKPNTVSINTLNGVANVALRTYCWNTDGTLASQKDYLDPVNTAKFSTTSYTYLAGSNGLNVQSVTVTGYDGSSTTRSYTYDSLGRKATETLARRISATNPALTNLTTTYQYDALDRVTRVTDPLGNIAETVYDANGKVKQVNAYYKNSPTTFITRALVTRTYDLADRLATETDVYNNTSTFAYDNAGNGIKSVDANGHTTRYEYDEMNRRTAVIDANGYRTVTTYDLAGHPVAVTNPNGKTTRSTFDALGRVTAVTTPLGFITQFSEDANNNVTSIIDANAQAALQPKNLYGHTVTRLYDELNRLIQETDALNGVTRYGYDLAGNLTSLTDAAGKTTTNVYDGLGRLITVIDPLIETPVDKVVSYTWDEAGNPLTKTDRLGNVTRTTYDALNRPGLTEYLTDATTESIVYDIYGNHYNVSNGAVTYSYTYDLKNRMLTKTDSRLNLSISYTYDKVGNIQTKTDYQGDITTYEYDASNRLVAETNPAYLSVSYQYDGASRLLGRILSNGAKTSYVWDDDDRLSTLVSTSANNTQVSNVSYIRDRIGNILTASDLDGLTTYTYDALYQLKTAVYPGTAFSESFVYDAVGNRQTHTQGGAVHAYEYYPSSNRLKAIHTASLIGAIEKSFTYNDEGQLTTQTGTGSKALTWDQKGRPKAISPSGFTSNTFGYDPMDRRITRSDSHGNQSELLEGDHLEAIYSGVSLQAKYMRGAVIDEVVNGYQFDTSGAWTNDTYHHDKLQSVQGLSGHDGTVLSTQTYTAFGESRSTAGTTNNNLKYTGRELDSDSGLYQYRARYYDPAIGRFISEDPKGFAAGINFFAYTNNNPVNANDPTGFEPMNIYGVTPATRGFSDIASTNVNVAGQRVLGALGTGYAHLAIEIAPKDGVRYIAQAEPSGVQIVAMDKFMSDNISRGSSIDRYVPNVAPTDKQITVANSFAQSKVGAGFNWFIEFSGSTTFQCAEFADATTKSAGMPGINSLPSIGLTPLPSELSLSPNYSKQPLDYERNFDFGNTQGSAAGGFLLYPNKANTNQMQSVYAK